MLQASGDHDCDHDLGECSTTDFSSREALGEDLMDCHLWGRFTHLIATPQLSAYHLASPGGPWSSRSHLSEMESFGSPIPVESECVSVCVCVRAQLCPTLCDRMDCSRQASLSMGFPWQEHWSGLPFPIPGDLPNPRIESTSPVSPTLQADSLPT